MSIKLLTLFPSTQRGGAEAYALTLTAAAARQGWQTHVAFPAVAGTASLIEEFRAAGVAYHPLAIAETASRRFRAAQEYLLQFGRTIALLLKLKPDVVLLNLPWYDSGLGSLLACALLAIPTAAVFHLIPAEAPLNPARRRFYTWSRARNQQWITISDFNRQLLSSTFAVPTEAILRIYNGTAIPAVAASDLDRDRQAVRQELGLSPGDRIILTVGRLEPQKGYPELLACLPDLVAEFPDARFVWVGEGALRSALEQSVQEAGLEEQVQLLGYRSDVPRLLKAADLFVFPTRFEGHPLALLEAMAYGVPIVASDASSIPEMIESGVEGLLFQSGDRTQLLNTLRQALAQPERMQAMALNAQRRVQEFAAERMIHETLTVLRQLSDREAGNTISVPMLGQEANQ